MVSIAVRNSSSAHAVCVLLMLGWPVCRLANGRAKRKTKHGTVCELWVPTVACGPSQCTQYRARVHKHIFIQHIRFRPSCTIKTVVVRARQTNGRPRRFSTHNTAVSPVDENRSVVLHVQITFHSITIYLLSFVDPRLCVRIFWCRWVRNSTEWGHMGAHADIASQPAK